MYDGKQNTFLCTVLKLKSNYFPRQNKVVKKSYFNVCGFRMYSFMYMGTGEDLISGKYWDWELCRVDRWTIRIFNGKAFCQIDFQIENGLYLGDMG